MFYRLNYTMLQKVQYLLQWKLCGKKNLWCEIFLGPNHIWCKIFCAEIHFGPKIFCSTFLLDQHFLSNNSSHNHIFLPKCFWTLNQNPQNGTILIGFDTIGIKLLVNFKKEVYYSNNLQTITLKFKHFTERSITLPYHNSSRRYALLI